MTRNRVWIPLLALATGCTWVQLTEEGAGVRVRAPGEVASCEKLGETRANTRSNAGIFARSREKVAEELEHLARNEAAEVGGNAIVPRGPATLEGKRAFDVYRCP